MSLEKQKQQQEQEQVLNKQEDLSPEEKKQKEEARAEAIEVGKKALDLDKEKDSEYSKKEVKAAEEKIFNLGDDNIDVTIRIKDQKLENNLSQLNIGSEDLEDLKQEISGLNKEQTYNKINMLLAASLAESLSQKKVEGASYVQKRVFDQLRLLEDNEKIKKGELLINLEKFIKHSNKKGSGFYVEGLDAKLEEVSGYKKTKKGILAKVFGSSKPNFEGMINDLSKALGVDNSQLIEEVKTAKEPTMDKETATRHASLTHSGSFGTKGSVVAKADYLVEPKKN